MAADPPELLVPDAAAWRDWLAGNGHDEVGVWLVLARKGTTSPTSLVYQEALLEALCQGWVDGQVKSRDEATFRQRFTPRRRRSLWSRRNTELVAGLIESGRMQPRGFAEIERAKADGRWDAAYAGAATIAVPDDLAAALAAQPQAAALFAVLTSQNRYAILHRVSTATAPATRARRIEKYVAMLAAGETVYPQKRRP